MIDYETYSKMMVSHMKAMGDLQAEMGFEKWRDLHLFEYYK